VNFYQASPTKVEADSPSGLMMRAALREHPFLYGRESDPFAAYRVYEYWFFTIGNGLEWDKHGWLSYDDDRCAPAKRLELMRDLLANTPVNTADERRFYNYSKTVLNDKFMSWPPVHLYTPSRRHAHMARIPNNVEPSFLLAALELTNYLLSRPIWENWTYDAQSLMVGNSSTYRDAYRDSTWRNAVLASGAEARALVSDFNCELVLGPLAGACRNSGIDLASKSFYPLDYSLPPLVIRAADLLAQRGLKLPRYHKKLAERGRRIARDLSKILKEGDC
jgi:hypothetical protein